MSERTWIECASTTCETPFVPVRRTQIYCSNRCKKREERRRQAERARAGDAPATYERSCPACGKAFTTTRDDQKYCSRTCRERLAPAKSWAKKTRHMHPEVRLVDGLTAGELAALAAWPHIASDEARREVIADDVRLILEGREQ